MNPKNLAVLALLTIVLVAAALLVSRPRSTDTPKAVDTGESVTMLPGVAEKVPGVTSIEMKDSTRTLTFRRADAKSPWTLGDKHNYPALADRVNTVLGTVANLRIAQEKTSKPERYAMIGVDEPDKPGSTGKLITLKDAGGGVVASIIVGNSAEAGAPDPVSRNRSAFYARKAGDAQSYLVFGSLTPETDAMQWIERTVLQLDRSRIRSVTVTRHEDPAADDAAKAGTFELFRESEKDVNFALRGLPPGRELKEPAVVDAPVSVVGYVLIDDVRPLAEVDFAKSDPAGPVLPDAAATPFSRATVRYSTFDGLVVTAKVTRKDAKYWVTFDAAFDEKEVVPAPATPTPQTPEAPAPTSRKSAEDVKKEATDLTTKLAGWAYAISETNAKQLATRLSDLLQPVKPTGPEPVGPLPTTPQENLLVPLQPTPAPTPEPTPEPK
ncbi:MAG: DUF4340 domain-containing protein [Planctomycetota bacterium]